MDPPSPWSGISCESQATTASPSDFASRITGILCGSPGVGCGPGLISALIAEECAREVVGIYMSTVMLRFAEALPAPPNLRFEHAKIADLGDAHRDFDVVFCGDVPLPRQARTILLRCLRPGGALVVRHTNALPGVTFSSDNLLHARLTLVWREGMRLAGVD